MNDYPEKRYHSFNDFFTRTILPERRPVDPVPEHLVAPCDSKLTLVSLKEDASFQIKGVSYTAETLLRSSELARQFAGGTLLIFRLTVDDYHHYLYPLDGTPGPRVAHSRCISHSEPLCYQKAAHLPGKYPRIRLYTNRLRYAASDGGRRPDGGKDRQPQLHRPGLPGAMKRACLSLEALL